MQRPQPAGRRCRPRSLLAAAAPQAQARRRYPALRWPRQGPLPDQHGNPLAQRYFDQGLGFAYGFNHAAAIASFREAQRLDPDCAMCLWGEALAHGPNINAPMDPEANARAVVWRARMARAPAPRRPNRR